MNSEQYVIHWLPRVDFNETFLLFTINWPGVENVKSPLSGRHPKLQKV